MKITGMAVAVASSALAQTTLVTRVIDQSKTYQIIPLNSAKASMNWAMTATVSARQKTSSDPIQMHVKLSVKNELDQNGDYAYLPDNCMVQTFFQIRNKVREVELVQEAEVANFLAQREREELIA